MRVEWNETKNRANRKKHGVNFELAQEIFDDPLALSKFDRIEDGEERWHTLGTVENIVLLLVTHTARDDEGEEVIRISRHVRRPQANGDIMKKTKRSIRRKKSLRALKYLPEKEIDINDVPEVRDWGGAVRGRFYRPIKKAVSLRLDADVLAWFKARSEKYQSKINEVLREYMNKNQ